MVATNCVGKTAEEAHRESGWPSEGDGAVIAEMDTRDRAGSSGYLFPRSVDCERVSKEGWDILLSESP